jgi:hypothetical protein
LFSSLHTGQQGYLHIKTIYSIDRITKSHYKADVKKDSITLAPAGDADKPQPQETEKEQ